MLSRTSSRWGSRHSIQCKNLIFQRDIMIRRRSLSVMRSAAVMRPSSTSLLSMQQHQKLHRPFGSIGTTASYHVLPRSSHLLSALGNLDASSQEHDETSTTNHNPHLHRLTQVRYKRKVGASAFKPRPPTRKQRKKYYRRMRKLHFEKVGKHSAPGSVAGPLRQEEEEERQFLLKYAKGEIPELTDKEKAYDFGDALVDDLFGNSTSEDGGGLLCAPTPKPVYLGHHFRNNLANVSNIMEQYHSYHDNDESTDDNDAKNALAPTLPTDDELSKLIRSYRDKRGTKRKPCGVAPVLKLLLLKLRVPSTALGPKSYTSLMTCSSNPSEARRIMKMMAENHCPPNEYAYSILIDIHAKRGDFRGCADVMNEMVIEAAIQPTLPAYTSLLAACYKACQSGAVPQPIKAEAGELAWNKWKEMFSSGIEPDVMAYGALMQIMGARGFPERAINIIDEMRVMEVKPTTLIFTSALRAVARSHNNAQRFNSGRSKRNKRREWLAAHHGNMARQIVIKAEQAEVQQDDGFVAALMLCAAAQGDVATAKAILLASEVRRMDHLRTIGGKDHLKKLRGEDDSSSFDQLLGIEQGEIGEEEKMLSLSSSTPSSTTSSSTPADSEYNLITTEDHEVEQTNHLNQQRRNRYPSFEEREYGPDTRKLTALLLACSNAAESRGLGDMWAGRDNYGCLDETSLRLIRARPKPEYRDPYIPGVSGVKVGLGSTTWDGDLSEDGKKLKRKTLKARGQVRGKQDPDVGHTMDDLPDMFYQMFKNHPEYLKNYSFEGDGDFKDPALTDGMNNVDNSIAPENDEENVERMKQREKKAKEDEVFDMDELLRNDIGLNQELSDFFDDTNKSKHAEEDSDTTAGRKVLDNNEDVEDDGTEEYYFDDDSMRWKTRPKKKSERIHEVDDFEVSQAGFTEEGESIEGQVYYDDNAKQWKTKDKTITANDDKKGFLEISKDANTDVSVSDDFMKRIQEEFGDLGIDSITTFEPQANEISNEKENIPDFESFYADVRAEFEQDNGIDIDKNDAMAMYEMMLQEHTSNNSDSVVNSDQERGDVSSVEKDLMHTTSDHFSDFNSKTETQGIHDAESSGDHICVRTESNGLMADSDADQYFEDRSSDHAASTMEIPGANGVFYDESHNENDHHLSESNKQGRIAKTMLGTYAPGETSLAPDLIENVIEGDVSEYTANEQLKGQRNSDMLNTMGLDSSSTESYSLEEPDELELVLPGLPRQRIEKIRRTFSSTLGYPSMLRLIPVLRENMPDYISPAWLKYKNLENAHFVMAKAESDSIVDIHVLNGMLQVEASAGRLDKALSFYDNFEDYGVKPNEYSDRLVIQMLIKNNRISQALAFKEQVESQGRPVDILSYGSFVECYGKHGQLGSALMIIKECIAVHETPPGEKSLKHVRQICRRRDLTEDVGLVEFIGEDPLAWLHHGQANLKREYSYKGRRNLDRTRNALLRI